jgi:hypothetical protein
MPGATGRAQSSHASWATTRPSTPRTPSRAAGLFFGQPMPSVERPLLSLAERCRQASPPIALHLVQSALASDQNIRICLCVVGPARAGEKGTLCASAGPPLVWNQGSGISRSGSKSAAAPATVSGEPMARPPRSGLERGGSLCPTGRGKTGPEVVTREPGDLPASRLSQRPGGVPWSWEKNMPAITVRRHRRTTAFRSRRVRRSTQPSGRTA